jgi:hypothetical protein
VRALPRVSAGRWCRRRAGQLTQRHRVVVVRGSVPEIGVRATEVEVGAPDLREGEAVHRRRDRPVPAEPGAVPAAAPGGRSPGQPAQPGEQRPQRRGQPGRRGGEPRGGAQQVHGEVGGELDGRLQVAVHRGGTREHGRTAGRQGRHPGGRGGRPIRPMTEPVDAQRRAPPAQVRAVGAGAPGREAPVGLQPARPDGVLHRREASRVDAEHAHREPGGRPDREVLRGAAQVGGRCGTGAEQPGETGGPGGTHVGAAARRDLHSHGCRLPGSSCRGRGRDRGQGET